MAKTTTDIEQGEMQGDSLLNSGYTSTSASDGSVSLLRRFFWSMIFYFTLRFWLVTESISDGFKKRDNDGGSSSLHRGDLRKSYVTAIGRGYSQTSYRSTTSSNVAEAERLDVYSGGSITSIDEVSNAAAASLQDRDDGIMKITENFSSPHPGTSVDSGLDSSEDDVFDVFTLSIDRRWHSSPPERRIRRHRHTRNQSDKWAPLRGPDQSTSDRPTAPNLDAHGPCNCGRGVPMTVHHVTHIHVTNPERLFIRKVEELICHTELHGSGYTQLNNPRPPYADLRSQEPREGEWV